jgi:hypothetical protein
MKACKTGSRHRKAWGKYTHAHSAPDCQAAAQVPEGAALWTSLSRNRRCAYNITMSTFFRGPRTVRWMTTPACRRVIPAWTSLGGDTPELRLVADAQGEMAEESGCHSKLLSSSGKSPIMVLGMIVSTCDS